MEALKKISLAFAVLILSCPFAVGKGKKVTYGLEWGMTGSFFTYHSYAFRSIYGLIKDTDSFDRLTLHGELLGHVGYNIGNKLNISLLTGYSGLSREVRIIPFTARLSYFPKGSCTGSAIIFAEAGGGPDVRLNGRGAVLAKIGAGRRIMIGEGASVNFMAGYRLTKMYPDLVNPDTNELVPRDKILKNNMLLNGVFISAALQF